MTLRGAAVLVVKLGVTVALFATLLALLDFDQLARALGAADRALIVCAMFILFLRYPLMAQRWRLILAHQGHHFSAFFLVKITLISSFFALFLPGGSGGDIVRGVYLNGRNIALHENIAALVFDRFVGFFTSLAIAVPSAAVLAWWQPVYRPLALSVFGIATICAIAIFALNRYADTIATYGSGDSRVRRFAEHTRLGLRAIMAMTRQPVLLTKVVVLTLLLHGMGIYAVFLLGLSLDAGTGFVFYAVLIPIVWLVTAIPISIGGLGVREGTFVVLFTQVGMSAEQALAVSLLSFGLTVAQSLVGGISFLLDRSRSTPRAA